MKTPRLRILRRPFGCDDDDVIVVVATPAPSVLVVALPPRNNITETEDARVHARARVSVHFGYYPGRANSTHKTLYKYSSAPYRHPGLFFGFFFRPSFFLVLFEESRMRAHDATQHSRGGRGARVSRRQAVS